MKRKQLLACFIFLLAYTKGCPGKNADSLKPRSRFHFPAALSYSNNLSASYINYKNWKYNGATNYSFLIHSAIGYDSAGANREIHLRLNADLGYMKFVDSTWYKNTDDIDLTADIVKKTDRTFENGFSFYFSSQLLPSYENDYTDNGSYNRRRTGSFGNPVTIDLAYGTTVHLWKTSRISLTFVTLHTSVMPAFGMESSDQAAAVLYKKTLIVSEYGLGIQTSIRKSFGKRLRWENNSRLFCNAVSRQRVDLDFRNRIIVKLFKFLDLIADSRIRYMPYPPYKCQFRNELMLSFTFEKI